MKRVLLIGSLGNMGQRYQAILKHLNIPYIGIDESDLYPDWNEVSKIILATPTETHLPIINRLDFLLNFHKEIESPLPLLCEKPICKNLDNLKHILNGGNFGKLKVSMVNQYFFLPQIDFARNRKGTSFYNYFKHGTDGIEWDCIQLLGMANDQVYLNEDSPIWSCQVNGVGLDLSDMDQAYIDMIQCWDETGMTAITEHEIFTMHERAYEYSRRRN